MKKIVMMMAAVMLMAGCSKDDEEQKVEPVQDADGKTLVVYFSKTEKIDGTTAATAQVGDLGATQYVAQQVAELTGADMHRITVADDHYPVEYNALATFARNEKDNGTHPALTSSLANLAEYKNIIIGTPVWWYTVPMPIYSFLDAYDLSDKNVMVFTTHEGSGLADAISVIKQQEPRATVSESGFHTNGRQAGSQDAAIRNWIEGLGLTTK